MSNPEVQLEEIENNGLVEVCIDIANIGDKAGAEVVQLYIKDLEASVTRRIKELKGFKKVWLNRGEQKTITLHLSKEELAIWNDEMKFVVEAGNVKVMVGGDSRNTQEIVLKINH